MESPPKQPPLRQPRVVGFQRPWTSNQLTSWSGQVVSNALFYGLMGTVLRGVDNGERIWSDCLALAAAHLLVVLLSLGCFLFMETHDPTKASCFGSCLPDSPRWTQEKYCGMHKQRITGLDHFCTWLNVSVGRSNYLPFVWLVSLGLVQFALQAVTGMLLLTVWRSTVTSALSVPAAFVAFTVLHEVIVIPISCMYALLLSFHCYLGIRGLSTYDFLLEQRTNAASGGPDGVYAKAAAAKRKKKVTSQQSSKILADAKARREQQRQQAAPYEEVEMIPRGGTAPPDEEDSGGALMQSEAEVGSLDV